MKPRSLRLRLLLAAAMAVLVAMALSWAAMTWLFARHITKRAASELESSAALLLANLSISADGAPLASTSSPSPLFEQPASGRYWQLSSVAGTLRSRSLWDGSLPASENIPSTKWRTRHAEGPFGQHLLLLERTVTPALNAPPLLVQLAHDEAPLVAARNEFARELALFLAFLWVALSVAAAVQVRLGLQPLASLRRDLLAMRRQPDLRLPSSHPQEVLPLVEAINQLMDSRASDLSRARRRSADLAHSLKTPLAALQSLGQRVRALGAVDAAEGIDFATAAMTAAVESELGRMRAASAFSARYSSMTCAQGATERVVGVLEHTEAGERLVFEVDLEDGLRLPLRAPDLHELLGALLENAARFAHRRVRISGSARDQGADICIEDDGTGLPPSARQVLMDGGKLDEAGPGHQGLGIAIARELAEATGATLSLGESALGGLRATLHWSGVAVTENAA